jgi:hypothetical protein
MKPITALRDGKYCYFIGTDRIGIEDGWLYLGSSCIIQLKPEV